MPRLRAGFALSGLLLALLTASCRDRSAVEIYRDLSLHTEDGVALVARLYIPDGDRPPGLLLAHGPGRDRAVWESFAELARRRGYLVLALDLRGHGQSGRPENIPHDIHRFSTGHWLGALNDLSSAKDALIEHGADPENLAVIGEDLGANLALHFAARDPAMQAAVLISPGLNYRGIETEPVLVALKDCPVLLLASEDDAYAAMSASTLKETAPVFSELLRYPGAAHGADLLLDSESAASQILEWLDAILRRPIEKI